MVRHKKLKPDRSIFGPIQPVIVLIIFGLTIVIWGIKIALTVLVIVYLMYFAFTMYAFFRVKNYYFITAGFFQIMMAVFLTFNKIGPMPLSEDMIRGIVIIMICQCCDGRICFNYKKTKMVGTRNI